MKKFIDCFVPVMTCNLRCAYCYITQQRKFENELPKFDYTADYIGKALSQERLEGVCHFNFCGGGETLLPIELLEILREILKHGHYIMIVTNGTLNKRFDDFSRFPYEYRERLGFKFSFHYMELKRTEKINDFFSNVEKMRKLGCSVSIELTPCDEMIPYIDDIKSLCKRNLSSLCHITIARDNTKSNIPILTQMPLDQYKKIWGSFNSEMFRFKLKTFNKKRLEFCYAGAWGGYLNIGTGEFKQCYHSNLSQNIYEDIKKKIKFLAIGKCKEAHCYNSHAFLTLGLIPELKTPVYADIRNRVCDDGREWLNPKMKEFLSHKLVEFNCEYTNKEKVKCLQKNKIEFLKCHFKKSVIKKSIKKIRKIIGLYKAKI